MANSITVTGIDTYVSHFYEPRTSLYWDAPSVWLHRWYVKYKPTVGKRISIDYNGGLYGDDTVTDRTGSIAIAQSGGTFSSSFIEDYLTLQKSDDGYWWGRIVHAIRLMSRHDDITVAANFSLGNTGITYSLPSGFTMEQFVETLETNFTLEQGGSLHSQNTIYWKIREPHNQYISSYTVYFADGTSTSVNRTEHIPVAYARRACKDDSLITRIVFTASTGYRVRVRFSGDGTANATAKINDVVVSDKIFSGGQQVVVKLSATDPSRIKQASVLVKYYESRTEKTKTINLPGSESGRSSCTSTRIGTSSYPPAVYTYRDITFTINSIDRSYEFTVPLETLYNLIVVDDSDAYIKNQSGIARQFGFENTSAGTSFVGWLYPQTRSRVAALGDEVAVSFKTGSTDGYIYQVTDDAGNVLDLNTAKADLVSVPVEFPAGNLTLHIVARRKALEVTQRWWGPYAEFIGTSGSSGIDWSLVIAKYPGIDACATHGTGSYDYGDRVELYPEPAQGFQFYGMTGGGPGTTCNPRRGIALFTPDPTSASPYVIAAINTPYTAVVFFGPTTLQLVKSVEGPGSISGGDEFAVPYTKNTHLPVTLTALAGADGVFSHWEYAYTKRDTNANNEPAILPVIVDATTEDQQTSITIDPTKILDGIITIKAVFAYLNPGALLHGNSGALLHGASGTLLFQG